jgi:hypothetical protein
MIEKEGKKKKGKEKMSYQGYTKTLFSTHPVLLKNFRRDNSNHTLKYH